MSALDGKKLFEARGAPIDYVQHNQEKFNVTLGQDIITVIVDAFLKSQK